jgi:RHS repeat-associated protein
MTVNISSNKSTNEYTNHQVTKQTDRLKRETTFEYKPFFTKTKNVATGAETLEEFTSGGQANSITHGYGTSFATTESRKYDFAGDPTSVTDGNGHTTEYGYDGHSNRISMLDPNNHETKWTYNSTHDVETETKPNGETTTYKRDSHGNPEVIERPAPESKTQTTKYKYDTHGNVESMEDPLKRVTKYEYDTAGDKTTEIDPESDKRTWGYNEDSQETSTVSPRGHVKAGEEAKYTTKTERDAQGRPIKVTDPLLHETKYKYDGDGNLEVKTDPELHETVNTYDADNEQTKVKEPNGTVTETGYDGSGKVTSQTDGNKNETKYVRNILEQITEVVDPLSRKTTKEYDLAGNLKALTDPKGRTTTYAYDAANRPKEVSYSDGKTPAVKYEYNSDGKRTKMTDGTGTTTYGYDQLDRLTETENGHKEIAKYEYDLANEQTKITYPNTKSVTRAYDKAGRLEKVTDWSSNVTKFAYDADSDLKTTTYPTGTTNVDTYTYDETDAIKEVKMTKGAETLASLLYTRNKDSQVKGATSKGLPGEEKPAYEYDTNSRLTKGATIAYKYDAANNPTTIGTGTYKYDKASELETGPSLTYTYDELGERTKTKPTSGPATTYGYDQASDLTSVERPKEGEKAEIKDTYAYNGDGLRTSQTINGTTTYMAWEEGIPLPLLLTDGTNNYIYGPGGLPTEQISATTTLYLHHDQQGSTRLLTASTGAKEASFTYDAYGNQTGHTGTVTTPLGYDGQYTDSDTGLIYLRARYYDPGTGQFISNDPQVMETRAPYTYASDNPLSMGDPTGLTPWSPQIKHAVAQCRSWKGWHSKRSPYYRNRNIYLACQDLLTLPSQVYGTSGQGGGKISTGQQVGLACGLGGGPIYLITRSARGGAEATAATATFCVGYDAGTLLVRPLLHKVLPTVFGEE